MYKFVYVGRLDQEKGLKDIVFAFEKIVLEKRFDVRLDLFGQEGNCSALVYDLQKKYPDAIHYHGRQPKSFIAEYRTSCHYVIMPSLFLETFGLVCLDAYCFGKPVIGYQKGGLRELVLDTYAISQDESTSSNMRLYKTMVSILEQYSLQSYQQHSEQCKEIFDRHSKEQWKSGIIEIIQSFDASLPKQTAILMISDYLHVFGGLETFFYEAIAQLHAIGYSVDYFGGNIRTTLGRICGLPYSALNITSALGLLWKAIFTSYDVFWFHSVQRYLGRLPIVISFCFRGKKLFMLHDLGLLHPYPSLVTKESDLQFPWTISGYLGVGKAVGKRSLFDVIAIVAKFCSSSVFRLLLQRFDCLLVPSTFLKPALQHRLGGKYSHKIKFLAHFVDLK